MDDFDVVTGPAPGLAAKLKPPAPNEKQGAEHAIVSPPSPPSPASAEPKERKAG